MKNYTWIEFPTWILAHHLDPDKKLKLNTSNFILIAQISSKVDESGYISFYELGQTFIDLKYEDESILGFFGSNSILSMNDEYEGCHLNFFDKKQTELLAGEKIDNEDRISRLSFPLEVTEDKRLSLEDFTIIAFCFEFSKLRNGDDYSFIDGDVIKVFSKYFGLRLQDVRTIAYKLESLGYFKLSEGGIQLLPKKNKNKVFISYSHKDVKYLQELKRHLNSIPELELEIWDDTMISVGTKWDYEITNAIETSQIAIVLISADLLSSKYVRDKELPLLIEKSQNNLIIIGVYISSCLIELYPEIVKFQLVNGLNNPIDRMDKSFREQIWVKTVKACLSKTKYNNL